MSDWAIFEAGSGQVDLLDPPDHAAFAALTGESEAQDATLYQADRRRWSMDRGLVVDMRVKLSVIPTLLTKCAWGLASARTSGPDSVVRSVWFAVLGNGAVLCEMDDGITDRSVATNVTLAPDTAHQFMIDASNKSDVRFFIDGVRVCGGTTFAFAAAEGDASALQLYMTAYKSSGAGVGTVVMDSVRAWMANRG